ncbi:adenylate kinase [Mesoplasma photuris]|uniref:adenylate kinase n=1 Tax=Mesoplasma photuris TaxID=217731 RepID=UPI0004E284DA
MNIMLLGAPGSGKGTQAEKLVKELDFIQFSTGDLFRKEISNQTKLGVLAASYMNEGNLVPDDLTNGIVNEGLKTQSDQLIFDGYPRTLNQAIALEEMLTNLNSKIDYILFIDVDKEILLDRIAGRMICPKCKASFHLTNRKPKVDGICDFDGTKLERRPDDEPAKVLVRLETYEADTKPLIDFYSSRPGFIHIKATDMDVDSIFAVIKKGLNK